MQAGPPDTPRPEAAERRRPTDEPAPPPSPPPPAVMNDNPEGFHLGLPARLRVVERTLGTTRQSIALLAVGRRQDHVRMSALATHIRATEHRIQQLTDRVAMLEVALTGIQRQHQLLGFDVEGSLVADDEDVTTPEPSNDDDDNAGDGDDGDDGDDGASEENLLDIL